MNLPVVHVFVRKRMITTSIFGWSVRRVATGGLLRRLIIHPTRNNNCYHGHRLARISFSTQPPSTRDTILSETSSTVTTLHPVEECFQRIIDSVATRESNSFTGTGLRRAPTVLGQELVLEFFQQYQQLPSVLSKPHCQRVRILQRLAMECAIREDITEQAVAQYQRVRDAQDPDMRLTQAMERLRQATTPFYEDIYQCLLETSTAETLSFILHCRADLKTYGQYLRDSRGHPTGETPSSGVREGQHLLQQLKALESYLKQQLVLWCSPSLLQIQRISYDTTPAAIVERIVRREAVHPISNLNDLRDRLGPQRRVFGLFHPLLPDTPLIVLYISLQTSIPSSMQHVQDATIDDAPPTVAAFYSISNLEAGVAGTGLGEYLIKQSALRLQKEFPSLQTFVTLSPIPGFRKWLEHQCTGSVDDKYVSSAIIRAVSLAPQCSAVAELMERVTAEATSNSSTTTDHDWFESLVAHYLVREKHRGKPLDIVARFHVGNGAALFRINRKADTSRRGWQNSFGFMVNYQYNPPEEYPIVDHVKVHDAVQRLFLL